MTNSVDIAAPENPGQPEKNDVRGGHTRRARRPVRSASAVVATLALAVLGGGALVATGGAAPAAAVPSCTVNPMGAATPVGSADGFTFFVTGDAILANSELEGSLAVLGSATFGDTRSPGGGQYPIVHSTAGNSAYSVPTIDGDPTRVLLQRYAGSPAAATKVVQVKNQGDLAGVAAGFKLADLSSPAGYTFSQQFGGSGTTFYPVGGSNQSAQIESQVTPWVDRATAQAQMSAELASAAAYFPADDGEAILDGIDYQTPAVTQGQETRVTLSADGPSRIALSDLVGAQKLFLTGYSESSFLVVTVSPADVVSGQLTLPTYAGAGSTDEGSSYLLWDLSAIDGDVTVHSTGNRVRGSVYAPNAHITFPGGGSQFEGQIIAAGLSALQGGEELHTNLFKGEAPCSTEPTPEPTVEPTTEPTVDPTTEPTVEPTVDPTTEPTVDPTTEPTVDPTKEPTVDPTTDPTADPTTDPTVDPTTDATTDPTVAATTPSADGGSGSLASTGVAATGLIAGAVALVGLGVALVRRRHAA